MGDSGKRILSVFIESLLALMLVYAPVAFAGAAQVYRPVIWIGCAILFALTLFHMRGNGAHAPVGRKKAVYREPVLVFWFFGAFLLLQVIYLAPFPGGPLHPAPETGLRNLFDWFSAFTLFFVTVTFPSSRGQIRRICFVILAVAGFEAFYGMIEYAGGQQQIFGYIKTAYLESATGTFVNRNHYGNYLGLALCLCFGLMGYSWVTSSRQIHDRRATPVELTVLMGFFAVLPAVALVLSRSRGALVSLGLAGVGIAFFASKNLRRFYFAALAILVVGTILVSLLIGKSPLPERFLDLPEEVVSDDARPEVWARSAAIWLEHPAIGTGQGAFADRFRIAAGPDLLARYLHAHNDYLEVLVELGLVGALLLFGGIFLSLRMTLQSLGRRNSRFARLLGSGMVGACILMLIHSLFDFGLQIPANRLTFFAILGLAHLTAGRRMTR